MRFWRSAEASKTCVEDLQERDHQEGQVGRYMGCSSNHRVQGRWIKSNTEMQLEVQWLLGSWTDRDKLGSDGDVLPGASDCLLLCLGYMYQLPVLVYWLWEAGCSCAVFSCWMLLLSLSHTATTTTNPTQLDALSEIVDSVWALPRPRFLLIPLGRSPVVTTEHFQS